MTETPIGRESWGEKKKQDPTGKSRKVSNCNSACAITWMALNIWTFLWNNSSQGLALLLLIDAPARGDNAIPVRYHHGLNVNKMLADAQEAFASVPIKEGPRLVAVNVSRGRAEENCVQATSTDLLQNGKCYWMRKCRRQEIEIESRTQIISELQKSLKVVCIKFTWKVGRMRKKWRSRCVCVSVQSIYFKRARDLRANTLNVYYYKHFTHAFNRPLSFWEKGIN